MAYNIQSTSQVLIHAINRGSSQRPFTKCKGIVQAIAFHPTKPCFFAATHTKVWLYNLQKQQLVNKYQTGCSWISSISVHPGGDNFVIGSYDKKVEWFDMDMSNKPYQTLKLSHDKAVRSVKFSAKYPLFASSSDDSSINVFHGMVYNDLLQNALIVPVKSLKGHKNTKHLGVIEVEFHPTQPWLFSCGADGAVKLWV